MVKFFMKDTIRIWFHFLKHPLVKDGKVNRIMHATSFDSIIIDRKGDFVLLLAELRGLDIKTTNDLRQAIKQQISKGRTKEKLLYLAKKGHALFSDMENLLTGKW